MSKIDKKTKQTQRKFDLTSQQELINLKKYVDNLVVFDMVNEAYNFVRAMPSFLDENPDFRNNFPQLYNNYQDLIIKAQGVALPFLEEKEIVDLFEKHIIFLLKIKDLILPDKIKAKMVRILMYDQRDVFKRALRIALTRNNEILGTKQIQVDNKVITPSISNWLKDYSLKFGSQRVEKIKVTQYLFQDKNAIALSEKEKNLLTNLIELFEQLKLSSMSLEGMEEVVPFVIDGKKRILRQGKLETIKDERTLDEILYNKPSLARQEQQEEQLSQETPTIAQQIQQAYKGEDKFEQDIIKEEQVLSQKVRNDAKILREEFFRAVQLRNRPRTIATFVLLVKLNDLQNFLIEDEKLQKFMSVTWSQKYGQEFSQEFEKDPSQPKFIKAFIRFILEDKLEMSENESARVAARLANLFKKQGQEKYAKIAYFDLKDSKFKYFNDSEH